MISKVCAKGALVISLTTALVAIMGTSRAAASETFGINQFDNIMLANALETPSTQAGSHPYVMTTTLVFNTHENAEGSLLPSGSPKTVEVNLPAGVVVNPLATGVRCTEAEFENTGANSRCPVASAVGVVTVDTGVFGSGRAPVYNMTPSAGEPLVLEFNALSLNLFVHIIGRLQTGGDYGGSAEVPDIIQRAAAYGTHLTLWGDPSAESHDEERGECATRGTEEKQEEREKFEKENQLKGKSERTYYFNCPVERGGEPLLTMPTSCTGKPLTATVSADSWQEPGNLVLGPLAESPGVTECDRLHFSPKLAIKPEPEATATESPSGLNVDLKIPQEESLEGLAEADLKDAVVKLPAGMTVSPSAATGLGVCTDTPEPGEPGEPERSGGEIELLSARAVKCPSASKLGTVEVVTPLLEHPLEGSVYLAEQNANPFSSLFALYVVAEGSGVVIKLPGEIKVDHATGQLTVDFGKDPATSTKTGKPQFLPQQPFSELKMHFFSGPRAPLVTPQSCGTYTTTSVLTPYGSETGAEPASPPAEPSDSFAVGSGCGARGFSPTLTAGTTNPQAGGFSEEIVTIARNDGEQDLKGVTLTTPPGLLGMLSKVPLCQEPQASEGTCGEASQIGETTELVGPGSDPYTVRGGKVYLTGPYDNEPFGLSIVVPTTAGPFTLTGEHGGFGKEVVRASIAVNPKTGALTIASGPLPSILEGVPLDIRTINVDINRSEFTFNPTNCEELHVTSSISSTEGATATPSSRFQAANCAALPFKPSFSATTRGNGSDRNNGASLDVKITQQAGEAAIRSAHLELPEKLPARLSTLQKACTEATFDANPANCPPSSDVGTGIAHTPVLPVALEGPAYFVSHGGAEYPELVFVLQGDGVTIDLAGETHINTKTNVTSSTFGTVPDAPISSFEANLPEEPNSALATLTPKGLCGDNSLSMPMTIVGANGAVVKETTKVAIVGCPPKPALVSTKKHKHKRHKKHRKASAAKGKRGESPSLTRPTRGLSSTAKILRNVGNTRCGRPTGQVGWVRQLPLERERKVAAT